MGGTLNAHKISLHSNVKSYKCDLCPSAFKFNYDLKSHKEGVHSTEKNHSCDNCGKTFKSKKYLNIHVYRQHKKNDIKKKNQMQGV